MDENAQQSVQTSQKGINPMIYAVIAIVIILLIGGGYYLSKKAMAPTPSTNSGSQTATPTKAMNMTGSATKGMKTLTSVTPSVSSSSAMTANEQDVTITASNFKFSPSTITVKKGEKVKITFTNSDGTHDFVINEFNVKTDVIPAGQSQTVTFTADKTGTFDYYCSVANHRAMGMQGTLTVQ